MSNNIHLIAERSGALSVKTYTGYGYTMTICSDEELNSIVVKPDDPVYGCEISGLEFGRPYIKPKEIALHDLHRLEACSGQKRFAKNFCAEERSSNITSGNQPAIKLPAVSALFFAYFRKK